MKTERIEEWRGRYEEKNREEEKKEGNEYG